MPKPANKKDLLEACGGEYTALMELLSDLSRQQLHGEFPERMMNRNVRDVLAHLHHWQVMLLGWVQEAEAGKKPVMPAEGYKWSETPALNRQINKQYSNASLKKVRGLLDASHAATIALIDRHSNKQLFTKRHFAWTGSTSLGAYIIANSSSHYAWGRRTIQNAIQELG